MISAFHFFGGPGTVWTICLSWALAKLTVTCLHQPCSVVWVYPCENQAQHQLSALARWHSEVRDACLTFRNATNFHIIIFPPCIMFLFFNRICISRVPATPSSMPTIRSQDKFFPFGRRRQSPSAGRKSSRLSTPGKKLNAAPTQKMHFRFFWPETDVS